MSGFDKNWLALREPVDRKARASSLVDMLCRHLVEQGETASLLDIGCGTGSTYRTLAPLVPKATSWQLLDHDPLLLAEAKRQIGSASYVDFRQHDLNALETLSLASVNVVTASALFDLCSAEFCNRFIETLASGRTGLYAALNYDGAMEWTIAHPLDEQVVADFNQHQHRDKGFGPALGPDATDHLRLALESEHYRVTVATSQWIMGPAEAALQVEFLRGLERPLIEIGTLSDQQVTEWMAFRLEQIEVDGSSCMVGHTDLLALRRR